MEARRKADRIFALCSLPPSIDAEKNPQQATSGKSQSFAEAVRLPDTPLPRKLREAENSRSLDDSEFLV